VKQTSVREGLPRRLAGFRKDGSIWIAKELKGREKRGVHAHMVTYKEEREAGASRSAASHKALKREHSVVGVRSLKSIACYEGKLGQIARDCKPRMSYSPVRK
jgi:hypothetical protein